MNKNKRALQIRHVKHFNEHIFHSQQEKRIHLQTSVLI